MQTAQSQAIMGTPCEVPVPRRMIVIPDSSLIEKVAVAQEFVTVKVGRNGLIRTAPVRKRPFVSLPRPAGSILTAAGNPSH